MLLSWPQISELKFISEAKCASSDYGMLLNCSQNYLNSVRPSANFPGGELSGRRIFRAVNFPHGEFSRGAFSARWIFRAANFPCGEFSARRIFHTANFPRSSVDTCSKTAKICRSEIWRGDDFMSSIIYCAIMGLLKLNKFQKLL